MNEIDVMIFRATEAGQRAVERRKRLDAWLANQPQSVPCPVHAHMTLAIDADHSSRVSSADNFVAAYVECAECKADKAALASRGWLSAAGVPTILLGATIENFRGDQADIDAARRFTKAPRGFFAITSVVSGKDFGVGKSHLAVAIMRTFGSGRFITNDDLLRGLRKTYSDRKAEDIVEACSVAKILVIDDLGLSAGGADEMPMLHSILDYRHGQRMPTVFTSNKTLDECLAVMGERMADRIKQSLFKHVKLTGRSQRMSERVNYMAQ